MSLSSRLLLSQKFFLTLLYSLFHIVIFVMRTWHISIFIRTLYFNYNVHCCVMDLPHLLLPILLIKFCILWPTYLQTLFLSPQSSATTFHMNEFMEYSPFWLWLIFFNKIVFRIILFFCKWYNLFLLYNLIALHYLHVILIHSVIHGHLGGFNV